MPESNNKNGTCKAHSGILSDVKHLEADNASQWEEINGMKKFIMTTLLMVCITLIGVLIQLAITLAK